MPWKASHGRGGRAGGRRSGAAPLACLWPLRFFLLEGDARYAALAPASRPARRAPQLRWVPALTPAPSAWAARRQQEEQKLQRPAAQRPGERRASFSPPPLRRPWEAQPPLRVAAAHSPQNNASKEDCFFCLANPTPREVRMKLIIAGSRTFTDYQLLCQTLAPDRHRITQVITSGAKGADQLGYRWAWKGRRSRPAPSSSWSSRRARTPTPFTTTRTTRRCNSCGRPTLTWRSSSSSRGEDEQAWPLGTGAAPCGGRPSGPPVDPTPRNQRRRVTEDARPSGAVSAAQPCSPWPRARCPAPRRHGRRPAGGRRGAHAGGRASAPGTRARAGGEPPRARPLRAARPAGTAVWPGRCEAHAPGDVVSPSAQQRHHPSFGAAPRDPRRPVPRLVRAGARGAGRSAERDGARLPSVPAHRDCLRLSPVLGGLCATRVPAHLALHGAD